MRLIRFANDQINYIFPQAQTSLDANFGGRRDTTVRVVGVSGGVDLAGAEPWQAEIGNVRVRVLLERDDAGSVRDKLDGLYNLVSAGLGRLFSDPGDGQPVRWCWAKVNNVDASENVRDVPHLRQFVVIDFQVASAQWYSRTDASYATDGTPSFGTSPRYDDNTLIDDETFDLVNNGNAYAPGVFTISNGGSVTWTLDGTYNIGQSGLFIDRFSTDVTVGDFKLQRLNPASVVVDEVALGELIGGTSLEFSTVDWSVTDFDYAAFAAGVLRGAWMAIPPGTTTYKVVFTGTDAIMRVGIDYWDTWLTG